MGKGRKVTGQEMLSGATLHPQPRLLCPGGPVTPRTHPLLSMAASPLECRSCQGWWIFWDVAGLGQGCPFCRRGWGIRAHTHQGSGPHPPATEIGRCWENPECTRSPLPQGSLGEENIAPFTKGPRLAALLPTFPYLHIPTLTLRPPRFFLGVKREEDRGSGV